MVTSAGSINFSQIGDVGSVSFSGDTLTIKNRFSGHPEQSVKIKIFTEIDPEKLPWGNLAIDWVVECSGRFSQKVDAQKQKP